MGWESCPLGTVSSSGGIRTVLKTDNLIRDANMGKEIAARVHNPVPSVDNACVVPVGSSDLVIEGGAVVDPVVVVSLRRSKRVTK